VTERRLHLLRHAKSSWEEPWLADHDRPLAPRGRRAIAAMSRHLDEQRIEPELVLCSTARRARETLDGIEPALARAAVSIEPELYGAAAAGLLARLHQVDPTVRSVMVIGHNPGLHDLALLLARPGTSQLDAKFPTGTLATLAISGWTALEPGTAALIALTKPRDLE
jgi:phosphohistidine phosphatase